jgi:EAL and modified HD-GYP domain-containing signal transduction protein
VLIDTYFARQPILDRGRRVRGYEVLYRSTPSDRATFVDPVAATAQVLANTFSDVAIPDLLAGLPAYVNLPRELIVSRALMAFPPDRVAAEVLEDVTPDVEVMEALADLRGAGYRVALDDFAEGDPRRVLVPFVDIVKVDLAVIEPDNLAEVIRPLRSAGVTLLAEKVETPADFQRCAELGFALFQGYFFARPELVAGRRLDEGRSRLVGLLAELHRPDITLEEVARSVERHPDLSFQLLRLLNSAAMGLPRSVDSIREAVVLVGAKRVTELATVLVLAANDHKPRELLSLGLTRARMCETVAQSAGRADPGSYFTVGVFSVLDALTDRSMPEVVSALPLSSEVKSALIEHDGPKGELLEAAIAYERAAWEQLPDTGLDPRTLTTGYLGALEWSTKMLAAV